MPEYNPLDWYWLADDGRVYASARQAIVGTTDAVFAAQKAIGAYTPWPRDGTGAQTTAALQDVLTPYGLYADLTAYAASARYARETGGITVSGVQVATDRDSQAMITGAQAMVALTPSFSTTWKAADGTFVTLSAAQITAVAQAVGAHVAACFAAEGQVDAGIASGSVTAAAQVDLAFAAVPASYPQGATSATGSTGATGATGATGVSA